MDTEEDEQQTYESVAADNNIAEEAFIAFCEAESISADECDGYVSRFEDAFIGDYASNADFAENYYDYNCDVVIPSELYRAINWDKVWDSTLRHDFYESNGYYFRNL